MRIVLSVVLMFFCFLTYAQKQEIRMYTGVFYYQGDLSPQDHKYSLSKGHFTYGLMFSSQISDLYSVGTRFLKGKVSGDDTFAGELSRRRRNLSFESDIYEYGIVNEFNLNYFMKGLDKFGINLYLSLGLNVFHFDPKTEFEGELIPLRPLHTEGQELAQFPDRKEYKLTQVNVPFGLGIQFNVTPNFHFGLEISPRRTFTDYLDDVSTQYVDFSEIPSSGVSELTKTLSSRAGEFLGTDPVIESTGTKRGDPNNKDWYLFTGAYFSYIIGSSPAK